MRQSQINPSGHKPLPQFQTFPNRPRLAFQSALTLLATMSDKIAQLDNATFKSAVAGATPTLVDFWAPWCGPCKAIAPILDELSTELAGKLNIAKVNVDDNGELAAEFGVRAIPTMLLFKAGQKVDQFVGMMDKASLKAKLAGKI
ncbi:MAG: Thioredoxin [Verrucomicrobia bacterium]|nr:Thioredoxin [Verrucomicrobiota bacterium]